MTKKIRIIKYEPYLKEMAKKLRHNMTLSEVLLWNKIKNKQVFNLDFDRQKPIAKFIVDFYCKDLKLAIEVDGDSHFNRIEEDYIRQLELEKLGIKFIRFSDLEIKKDINLVISILESRIIEIQGKEIK